MTSRRGWSRGGLLLVVLAFGFGLATWQRNRLEQVARRGYHLALTRLHNPDAPHIKWATVRPEEEGLDSTRLHVWARELASHQTSALLVVRGNRIVYEWYGTQSGPNIRHYTSAMAKAVTGTVALLAAATDHRLTLDDLASTYIPSWKHDSLRAKIRLRDLASHRSGLEDVDFDLAAEHKFTGWKQFYNDHPAERFRLALDSAEVRFPPGTSLSYAGLGYYALAYALTASLQTTAQPDISSLLRERIMRPLGIDDEDWKLSYGESYQVDGMRLFAMGSGAEYTARAVARMGQLLLDHGRWKGISVLDSDVVAQSLATQSGDSPPEQESPPTTAASGWWSNGRGSWPTAPRDAMVGLGNGHQVILVIPSLDLVVVRMGESIATGPDQLYGALRDQLIEPLMRVIRGPSSRMPRISAIDPPCRQKPSLRAHA